MSFSVPTDLELTMPGAYKSPVHRWRLDLWNYLTWVTMGQGLGPNKLLPMAECTESWTAEAYLSVYFLEPSNVKDHACYQLLGKYPERTPDDLLDILQQSICVIRGIDWKYRDQALSRLSELFLEPFPSLTAVRKRLAELRRPEPGGKGSSALRIDHDRFDTVRINGPRGPIVSRVPRPLPVYRTPEFDSLCQKVSSAGYRVGVGFPRRDRLALREGDSLPATADHWWILLGRGDRGGPPIHVHAPTALEALRLAAEKAGIPLDDENPADKGPP